MKTEDECLDNTCDGDTDMGSTTASPTASTAKPTTPVMPKTMVMEYKLFFDDRFLAKHKTSTEAKKQLKAALTHAQTHFCHASLGSKIKLKRIGDLTYWKGEKWLGTTTVEEYLSKLTLQKLGKADIALFIGNGHAGA